MRLTPSQVPVAPLLLEALQFSELHKTPKNTRTERPVDWTVLVKVSATDTTKRLYQEGLVQEALYILAEHTHAICHSIAFPELVAPTVLALRAQAKASKIVSLQKRCKKLLTQIEAQARFISSARDAVDFGPSDDKAAGAFLVDEKASGSTPFAKWFAQERHEQHRLEAQRQAEAFEQAAGIKVDDDDEEEDEADDDEADEADDGSAEGEYMEDDEGTASKKQAKGSGASQPATNVAASKKAAKKRGSKPARSSRGTESAGDGMALPDEVGVLRMEDL